MAKNTKEQQKKHKTKPAKNCQEMAKISFRS